MAGWCKPSCCSSECSVPLGGGYAVRMEWLSASVTETLAFCGSFFFSSRRRHTIFDFDWSSDVCSSDLRMQGNQVHFMCADDAHGAPIMLKAQSEGVTPQQLIARLFAGRPKYLQGFHLSFDHWYTTDRKSVV